MIFSKDGSGSDGDDRRIEYGRSAYAGSSGGTGIDTGAGGYIAAPSANTSGRPSPTCAAHVQEDLDGRIEMILDGGPVGIGLESTIVDLSEGVPTILRPGYINQQMLEEVIGKTEIDRAILSDDSGIKPKAPGMKYRHYAPKASLTIVEGEQEKVTAKINELLKEGEAAGEKIGVIASTETAKRLPGRNCPHDRQPQR